MILQRLAASIRKQDWFTVLIETLIVVLGVFLGIQLGNWNSARADQARIDTYLEQILIDLDGDIKSGDRGARYSEEIDEAALIVLTVIEDRPGASKISDEDLVASIPLAGYAYLPFGNDTTYQEMISTGSLALLRDTEFKREIANYYSWQAAGRQWDNLVREEQIAYRAAIRGVLTRDQFYWARNNQGRMVEERADLPPFDRAAFLERARARPEIIDSLRSMGAVQARLKQDSLNLAEEAQKMAARVEQELAER